MDMPDNLAHAVASTAAHEAGHLLGLVSEGYLGGTPKQQTQSEYSHQRMDDERGRIYPQRLPSREPSEPDAHLETA